MCALEDLKKRVLRGGLISAGEAACLCRVPLASLCAAAAEIREKRCGSGFDLCAIVNAKSGRCSEDCKFCAQSGRCTADISEYPLLPEEAVVAAAHAAEAGGALRFSLVTSGGRLSDEELASVCRCAARIKSETGLSVCASLGLLAAPQFAALREAGVERIHNNLESSEKFFPNICTTHSWREKTAAIAAARSAGLSVCSGGIIGLGETMEDRIDMAFELRALGIRSVPLNVLNPIAGTPFAKNRPLTDEEILRTVAIYRFILPEAAIRLAGGRGLLSDRGYSCFKYGANAAITGDTLTTAGISPQRDREMIASLGFEVRKDG